MCICFGGVAFLTLYGTCEIASAFIGQSSSVLEKVGHVTKLEACIYRKKIFTSHPH